MQYYIIHNGQQYGPMQKEELTKFGLNYNSDVWAEGMPTWTKASDVMELKQLLDSLNAPRPADNNYYFMMIGNQQHGPFPINELLQNGLQQNTPVWKNGMSNWAPASQVTELRALFASQTPPPFMSSSQHSPQYAPGQRIYNNTQNVNHTDWLPWAIAGTILGFLCYCIGCIFGIIAIVKANSANNLYREGNIEKAEYENTTARTMTIIALALSALGTLVSIFYIALI